MPRRKKGRPIHGWLIVDKPQGLGSTKVVSAARWALQAQKAGHSGTLDPLATGALAIAFGEATKTVPVATDGLKRYAFTVQWGAATDSDDSQGAVVATSDARPVPDAIAAAAPDFVGEIMQRPPSVSAIKVDGARAYDLARDGDAPELAPRPIWVESLDYLGSDGPDAARFEMVCGKGGYVRAVARDLGERLGCLGHVTALRRLATGPFDVSNALSFEDLEALREADDAEAALLPVSAGLADLTEIRVDAGLAAALRAGRAAPLAGPAVADAAALPFGDEAWASLDGAPVALCTIGAGSLRPTRVFNL